MSQTWTVDVYNLSHTASTDLQNMEDNFETLKSSFSGSSSPANQEAGMLWFDTSEKILKVRNAANSAWLGVMYGNSGNKIWMYRNNATNGWNVYGSVTDRVLAVKGGSKAYNRTGGGTAGTWTLPSHNHPNTTTSSNGSHVHRIKNYRTNDEQVYNSSGSLVDLTRTGQTDYGYGISIDNGYTAGEDQGTRYVDTKDWYSQNTGGHTHTLNLPSIGLGSSWRPAAAVGTMQYPHS